MTENLITYGIIVVIWILAILAFAIGIDKMIRVILGNYILASICMAASQSIELAARYLRATPELKIIGMSYEKAADFLSNGNMTIVLILYILLLIIVFRTSKIRIVLPSDDALRKMLQMIFVPLTVISIVLTLQIVLLGMNGININAISKVTAAITANPYLFKFINLTPVRILLHGIITILITSEFKVRVQTDL